ncbi:MAG: hypothetical protein E7353_03840, partial [Clostridiales bacterium]|nr:hypothetical protein [Clostridiales bacterium]
MNKFLKILTSSALALFMAFAPISGCAQSADYKVKAPTVAGSSSQTSTETEAEQIGLTAGFELPHDKGLVDNDETEVNIYDNDYYYLNQVRSNGADPGTLYVSEEHLLDSYTKLLAREQEMLGADFSQADFDKEYGTYAEWKEESANKFYSITTGSNGSVNATTKQKYPTAIAGLYTMRSSSDLNNWKMAGKIIGGPGTLSFAVMVEEENWHRDHASWAPEFNRDPISGLYIICGSVGHKNGNENTEYNPVTSLYDYYDEQWDRLTLLIAVSYNPAGPYRTISAEEY